MKDTIIKETGNSRFLRSNVAEDITFSEFISLLRAGQLPIDLAGINEEGIETLGMPLGKSALLDDETETAIWGDAGDRTPTEALKAIVTNFASALEGKIVTGTYTGTGNATVGSYTTKTITLGFKPKAVIVRTIDYGNYSDNKPFNFTVFALPDNPIPGYKSDRYLLKINENGFAVASEYSDSGVPYMINPLLNNSGMSYMYIAIA